MTTHPWPWKDTLIVLAVAGILMLAADACLMKIGGM